MIIDKTGKKYKTPNKKYNSVDNSIEDFKKMYGLETEENKLENYKQTSPTTPTTQVTSTVPVYPAEEKEIKTPVEKTDKLLENYNLGVAELDRQQAKAKQQAYINNELMMKYLPEHIKHSGIGTSASAQQAMLNQNANYMNDLSEIDESYNSQRNTLLENYNTAKYQEEKSVEEEEKAQTQQEQSDWYKQLVQNYGLQWGEQADESGKLPEDAYNKYLEEINSNENLSQHQKDLLINDLNNYKTSDSDVIDNKTNYGLDKDAKSVGELSSQNLISQGVKFKALGDGKRQDQLLSYINQLSENSLFNNGDIIDVNFGEGTYNLMYYEGEWYQTFEKATVDSKVLEQISELARTDDMKNGDVVQLSINGKKYKVIYNNGKLSRAPDDAKVTLKFKNKKTGTGMIFERY